MPQFPFTPATLFAPLHGVGHPEFREILARMGPIGLVCAPFVRVTGSPLGTGWLRTQIRRAGTAPLSIQLLGRDACRMAETARVLADAGVDAIDVNLGCPVRRIVNKGVGAALLREPELLEELLRTVRAAVPGVFSAKIRAGFDNYDDAIALAKRAERAGIDYLTVHPRRRSDHYDGVADWSIVQKIATELRIPVVGNGDLWHAADALRLKAYSGCAAVMIGRPALRNPWIFRQAAELDAGNPPFAPSGDALLGYFHSIADMLEASIGATRRGPVGPLKELVGYVLDALPPPSDLKVRMLRATRTSEILEMLARELRGKPPEEIDLGAESRFGLASCPESPVLKS